LEWLYNKNLDEKLTSDLLTGKNNKSNSLRMETSTRINHFWLEKELERNLNFL